MPVALPNNPALRTAASELTVVFKLAAVIVPSLDTVLPANCTSRTKVLMGFSTRYPLGASYCESNAMPVEISTPPRITSAPVDGNEKAPTALVEALNSPVFKMPLLLASTKTVAP